MKKPIIHLYGISYNEEVLMPHFLRHYIGFCDKIFIYDNISNDSTIKICKSFENVEIIQFSTNNQIRDDLYLKIKNEAWKKSKGVADFVIVCDIDELIYCSSILSFFEKAIIEGVTLIKCEGYNMITEKLPTVSDNIILSNPLGTRNIGYDKVLAFDPNSIEDINYDFGAHTCCPIGRIKFSSDKLYLLHYKYISLEYIQNRYKMFNSRLSNFNKRFYLGYHYSFSKFRIAKEFKKIQRNSINVLEKIQ